jgi:hypothetical protein
MCAVEWYERGDDDDEDDGEERQQILLDRERVLSRNILSGEFHDNNRPLRTEH